LFDGGRREAAVAQAQAEADVALAGARAQILHAFREVEDQLLALRVLAEQAEWHSRATAAASRAAALSASRWRNGLASQMELLDAQRQELHSQRLALQVQAAQQQATVGLIRALGGDWNPAPAAFGQAAAAGPV
jgi:multidrug efflux system outer membrane protein